MGQLKMGEVRSNFSKSVQKHAGRAKEKLMQNLGKADKTTDEIFEEHVDNFNHQQTAANRLNKELTNYIRCVRTLQIANKNLMDVLCDLYEPDWSGKEQILVHSQNLEVLWSDLCHKLNDQKRIDKRRRKLIDYDGYRHNYESMLSNPRRRDEMRIAHAKELLDEAKRTYETVTRELREELPALYNSRIPFYSCTVQTVCTAEGNFHAEAAKANYELEAIAERLGRDAPRQLSMRKENSSRAYEEMEYCRNEANGETSPVSARKAGNGQYDGPVYDVPVGATTEGLPSGVLYRVRAAYRYQAEDVDELTLEPGDVINVVRYDDPDEQEEGWLMGIKENSGQKGLFPANFTRPI